MGQRWLAVVAVVVGMCAFGAERRADACGGWAMVDVERRVEIVWSPSHGEVRYNVPNGKLITEFDVESNGTKITLLDAHGRELATGAYGHVERHGREISRDGDHGLVIGGRSFDITVSPTGKQIEDAHHTWYWFTVRVTADGHDVVTSAAAMGLCASTRDKPSPIARAHQREEIESYVLAYLGWRETVK